MRKSSDLEHVTKFFYENFKKFKIKNFSSKKNFSHIKMGVDTKKDLKLMESVYKKINKKEISSLGWRKILKKGYEKK